MAELWLTEEFQARPLTVLVFIHGFDCGLCEAYLNELNGHFLHNIRNHAKGELFVITSENRDRIEHIKYDLRLLYQIYPDTDNAIAHRLKAPLSKDSNSPLPSIRVLNQSGNCILSWDCILGPGDKRHPCREHFPQTDQLWNEIQHSRHTPLHDKHNHHHVDFSKFMDLSYLEKNYPSIYKSYTHST